MTWRTISMFSIRYAPAHSFDRDGEVRLVSGARQRYRRDGGGSSETLRRERGGSDVNEDVLSTRANGYPRGDVAEENLNDVMAGGVEGFGVKV